MKKYVLLILITSAAASLCAQTYTVETVPNTKLVNNSYVSNPDHILNEATVNEINTKLSDLEAKTSAQVALVVIQSIGDADIFDFAQRLFDKWDIGKTKKDNGLLVLLVMDQRTVRFHTGYGLEGVLPDAICKRIQMQSMVPRFKEEDYNRGVAAGIDEVYSVLTDPRYAEELREDAVKEESGWNAFFFLVALVGGIALLVCFLVMQIGKRFSNSKLKKGAARILYPEMRISRMMWLFQFAVIPVFLLYAIDIFYADIGNPFYLFLGLLYGYFILTLFQKRVRMGKVVNRFLKEKDYYGATQFFSSYQGYWLFMTFLFPLPLLFLFIQYLARKKSFRNHPRDCKACSKPLRKLDEKSDDAYLQKGQVFEEQLGTVDYDVWLCDACQATEVLNYVSRGSKYSACPKCSTRAFYKESDRTVRSATYDSAGEGLTTKSCKFCHHVATSTYSIPRLTRSSSSGGSSGSSGGGSWGGGSSGGGGASSSW